VACVFEFVGGSMGLAAGERVVRAYDRARDERLPVLVLACSGGARMQEGMLSLIQMARVADAATRHAGAGLMQVAYLWSPTTGGVYASFASLADVIWAEPGALLGFAGPRVVEVMTGERPDVDANHAEQAYEAGLVDAVLAPGDAARALATLLRAAGGSAGPPPARHAPERHEPAPGTTERDAWDVVQAARAPERASGHDWLVRLVPDAVEVRGDRAGGHDDVVAAGIGTTATGTAVAFVTLDRHRGDGRPRPAGYRTARRVVALAARLGLPVLTVVDTPGADPSPPSEHAGIAGEIARMLAAMTSHPAPTASVVVGEGGSGGALAFAATDRCFMLPDSIFSVIAPEGAAAILERDAERAPQLARRLRLRARDMVELGVVDDVVDPDDVAAALDHALATATPGEGRARLDSATRAWLHPT
jgi:acetyl-CoA carboxylase carboxyl transferase subunit beta